MDTRVTSGIAIGIAVVIIISFVGTSILTPAKSDDILVINRNGGNSSVTSVTSDNNAITVNPTSGNVVISPKWQLLAQNSTINTGGTLLILNQVLGSDLGGNLANNGGVTAIAEKITATSALVGQTVNQMTIGLKKSGSPSSTITVCIMDSASTCIYTFGSMSASSLTTSYVQYTFINLISSHTIASGNYIGAKSSAQNAGNVIIMSSANTDVYDGTNSIGSQFVSGAWSDHTTWDMGSSASNSAWKLELTAYKYIKADFTARKHLLITAELRNNASSTIYLRLNNDTNNNYALRTTVNGATSALTNRASCDIANSASLGSGDSALLTMWVDNNQSGDRKISTGTFGYGADTTDITAPSYSDFVCKWDNTSDRITSIVVVGYLTFGSIITVWGYD